MFMKISFLQSCTESCPWKRS